MNTLRTASFYYCKCQEQIVTVRNWPCALHRKGSTGFGSLQTVQCEDKEPQVGMHIIPLLKPPNTRKHKKADLSSWISLWPSESICGPWDCPGLLLGPPSPFQSLWLIALGVLHIPWNCLFPQSTQCQSMGFCSKNTLFFQISFLVWIASHFPQLPTPFRQHNIKQQTKNKN